LILLMPLSSRSVAMRLGSPLADVALTMRSQKLNQRDAVMLERGYYEDLMDVHRFNGELWSLYAAKPAAGPADWKTISRTDAAQKTEDLREYILRPNMKLDFKGSQLVTNQWGLRDREYSQLPGPNVRRWVFMGGSHVMGSGVGEDQCFESLLEEQLNRDHGAGTYEILNFGFGGYYALQSLVNLEQRVWELEPDAAFLFCHPGDMQRVAQDLGSKRRRNLDLRYDFVRDIVEQANVNEKTPSAVALRRLRPYSEEVLAWTYGRFVDTCRQHNIRPLAVMLPLLEDREDFADAPRILELLHEAGFEVLDLTGVYDAYDYKSLIVAEWDLHPNPTGHKLVSDKLYGLLRTRQQLVSNAAADE
jgi:hypothetical protein